MNFVKGTINLYKHYLSYNNNIHDYDLSHHRFSYYGMRSKYGFSNYGFYCDVYIYLKTFLIHSYFVALSGGCTWFC